MNKHKALPFIIGIMGILIVGTVVVLQQTKDPTVATTPNRYRDFTNSVPSETLNPGADSVTPPVSTPPSTNGSYTLAEVAMHNTQSDCWTTVNGGVYDVTSWIGQHPGGARAIISMCGVDGSSGFNGQHGGQARPASELASFKVGVLVK